MPNAEPRCPDRPIAGRSLEACPPCLHVCRSLIRCLAEAVCSESGRHLPNHATLLERHGDCSGLSRIGLPGCQ